MCGIAGIIDKNMNPEQRKSLVLEMNECLRHRGPDDGGYHQDPVCTLAMRRLSIIDLEGGQQPIYNADKSLCIVFNGEIYNFQALRSRLIKEGFLFRTNSDTEVVLQAYAAYGDACPTLLRGMFCFCIYDLEKQTWFIARDRFGEKPLYYYCDKNHFAFASEVKALLQDEQIDRVLNTPFLATYLSNTFIPEPNTLLKNVYALPVGSSLTYKAGEVNLKTYFKPNYQVNPDLKTEEDCIDFLRPKIQAAVKSQMISDVPIGAFLSGGIDSSTIVANMQQLSQKPVQTFTVRFEDAGYDESPIAREVAEYLGTDHHEITIPNQKFESELFWKIIDHVGLPFPDSSAIPTFVVTAAIRKHVKVALSGDGGDELFAGYPFYDWWAKVDRLYRVPALVRNLAAGTLDRLPGIHKVSKLRQLNRALIAAQGNRAGIGARMHILFTPREIKKLGLSVAQSSGGFDVFPEESDRWNVLQKAFYFRLKHNLPLDMLTKVDRMSMANSLEVRAPFLDADLFEASTQVPTKFLLKDGTGKYIIRKIMADALPASVFNHPKTGFSIPLHRYMNSDFRVLATQLLTENLVMNALFDKHELQTILARGLDQKSDQQMSVYRATHQLWALMQLSGWINRFKVRIED